MRSPLSACHGAADFALWYIWIGQYSMVWCRALLCGILHCLGTCRIILYRGKMDSTCTLLFYSILLRGYFLCMLLFYVHLSNSFESGQGNPSVCYVFCINIFQFLRSWYGLPHIARSCGQQLEGPAKLPVICMGVNFGMSVLSSIWVCLLWRAPFLGWL